jgi:hypothetical protein
MTAQLPFDRASLADEEQTDLKVTRGYEGAIDDGSRPQVAAHRVDGDAHVAR